MFLTALIIFIWFRVVDLLYALGIWRLLILIEHHWGRFIWNWLLKRMKQFQIFDVQVVWVLSLKIRFQSSTLLVIRTVCQLNRFTGHVSALIWRFLVNQEDFWGGVRFQGWLHHLRPLATVHLLFTWSHPRRSLRRPPRILNGVRVVAFAGDLRLRLTLPRWLKPAQVFRSQKFLLARHRRQRCIIEQWYWWLSWLKAGQAATHVLSLDCYLLVVRWLLRDFSWWLAHLL